ncbi:UvrD-helicase domain-containing protein [uncultured Pseudokineococcus sp.]|uniref:UvrD-helicase domain-containing protein n=1 Tax=uncultured Pseudokineococcus sp. TaxID=1642928 RepID=UPI002606C0DC|nr:UvrD-helicase domain-containing protein [uncultured Pseudokineococcus sp.]
MSAVAELDDGQRAVVEVAADERQVVVAPPGAGKTETAAALVAHLLGEEAVDPEALLVISFSRAAVQAVDARLAGTDSPLPDVRTLDSLARRIVLECDVEVPATFDRVVAEAARCVATGLWDGVEDIEHLVVDEAQDVVGHRADLLLALVEGLHADAGFTLLGDPAQAIYDFQLREEKRDRVREPVMALVSARDGVRVERLTGSYRGRTPSARRAVALRAGYQDDLSDATGVDEHVEDLVDIGDLEGLSTLLPRWRGTTAVLTEDNGQALLVHGELSNAGFRPSLRRPVGTTGLAIWVARLLATLHSRTLDRQAFEAALPDVAPDVVEARWAALRRTSRARASTVDVGDLVTRLRASPVFPPALVGGEENPLVVSTVHRAKGLEFDNVVVVRARRPRVRDDESPGYRRRTSYVAVTRARDTVAQVRGVVDWNCRKESGSSRWYRTGPKPWQTTGFQVGETDVSREAPPQDVDVVLRHVVERVQPGDPVEMSLERRRSSLEVPVYTLVHDGVTIGETSPTFGEALAHRLRPASRRTGVAWPALSGARVATVETVLGEPLKDTDARWGARAGVTLVGMLDLDWKG